MNETCSFANKLFTLYEENIANTNCLDLGGILDDVVILATIVQLPEIDIITVDTFGAVTVVCANCTSRIVVLMPPGARVLFHESQRNSA